MCFQINKDYAGDSMTNNNIFLVGAKKGSPASIADEVAVNSGVRNVKKNGRSALVVTAVTPQTLKENK